MAMYCSVNASSCESAISEVTLSSRLVRNRSEICANIIKEDIANGYKDGRFKVPGPGFLYMMSNENYVYNDQSKESGIVPPHVMFYAPYKTAKDLGYESISPTMVPYLTHPGSPQ